MYHCKDPDQFPIDLDLDLDRLLLGDFDPDLLLFSKGDLLRDLLLDLLRDLLLDLLLDRLPLLLDRLPLLLDRERLLLRGLSSIKRM